MIEDSTYNQMISFEMDDATTYGMKKVSGIIVFNGKVIRMEYQVKDAILGVLQSDLKEATIPFQHIMSCEVEKKWFSVRLRIQVNTLRALEGFPVKNGNVCEIVLKKKQYESARSFSSAVTLALSEYKLNQLGE